MGILNPTWLISQIDIIAMITAASLLVIFSSFVNKHFIFPIADLVKDETNKKIKKIKRVRPISGYLSDGLATIIFLIYCFLGTTVLATYVLAPVLRQAQEILIIIIVIIFLLITYAVNNKQFRKKFF